MGSGAAAGYSSFSSLFLFVSSVGLCRTCTRTGPRSTVTAFRFTSPCPLYNPPLCLTDCLLSFFLPLLLILFPFPSFSLQSLRCFYSVFLFSSSVSFPLFVSLLFRRSSLETFFFNFLFNDNYLNISIFHLLLHQLLRRLTEY